MGRRLTAPAAVAALAAAWPVAAAADPPPVAFTDGPSGPTHDATPRFAFASSDATAALTCRLDGPGMVAGAELPCASPADLGPLSDGDYVFLVHATDPLNPEIGEATRAFTVDTVPPGAPTLAGTPDGFTFSGEPGAGFVCRLDGPAGAGTEGSCASPQPYPGLAPGGYTFVVRAVDAAGNAGPPASLGFTVAPPPVVTPLPAAPPVPRLHATVVARPGLADVRVRLPGSAAFVPLTADRALPVGARVDARRGSVQLVSAPARGTRLQRATFHGAVFRIAQPRAQTVLTLTPGSCRAIRLSGDGRGAFAVRGRFSTASIRGARWDVQDSCSGTLTRALEGVVAVRDAVRHRTLLVRAGRRYTAQPKRR